MTVAELIRELQKHDGDLKVSYEEYRGEGFTNVIEVIAIGGFEERVILK